MEEILTYEEVLALLSEQARAGRVAALVSLERALRPEGPGQEDIDAELDRILGMEVRRRVVRKVGRWRNDLLKPAYSRSPAASRASLGSR